MRTHKKNTCRIITEGMAGTENQCIGIAEHLDMAVDIMRITLYEPWKTLSPWLGFEQKWSFIPPLVPPWPDLLIASGRKSIAAARYIKRKSGGRTVTVYIQDPRTPPHHFDLVAVPEHDPLRGENVIVTKATPNKVTPAKIQAATSAFPALGALPSPRVAVLIGGTSKAYNMTRAVTEKLAQDLANLDASLMITCSRRTGEENRKILETHFKNGAHFFWDGQGDNPYMAMLGQADYILVTADSASMISESCTTGKPVYMIPLEGGAKRIERLHDNLIRHGVLRKFSGALDHFAYEPLNDAQMVADAIKTRFAHLFEG